MSNDQTTLIAEAVRRDVHGEVIGLVEPYEGRVYVAWVSGDDEQAGVHHVIVREDTALLESGDYYLGAFQQDGDLRFAEVRALEQLVRRAGIVSEVAA
jgi:hypothetical protein